MSRRQIPSVNASLIHEARMLFQQFFGARQENYYSMRIAEAQAKAQAAPVLKCGLCIGTPANATFVINGWSACSAHALKARSATNTPKFN